MPEPIEGPLQPSDLPVSKVLYTNSTFPCLVQNGKEIEDPTTARTVEEKYRRVARNALRHLTYGVSVFQANLLTWDNFKSLFIERDPKLFHALRIELSHIFYEAYRLLADNKLNEEAQDRLLIFITNILAAYPYLDPQQDEIVKLPVKVNGEWQFVKYKFDKIDISPQKGILSKLLQDEDRLYAYGLVPDRDGLNPFLILMGSHYPSGQGALLNWLYNFTPMQSVGEGHDDTNIVKWLQSHPNAEVTGHSKGGTMAMILAVKYPQYIAVSHCLNPAPLSIFTMRRLNLALKDLTEANRPVIKTYVQMNDPVFLLGKHFIHGSITYSIGKKGRVYSRLEAHADYFAGRESVEIAVLNEDEIKHLSKLRELLAYIKEFLNFAIFPALYSYLFFSLLQRRVENFYHKYEKKIQVGLFVTGMGIFAVLAFTGVLAPLILPVAGVIGKAAAYACAASAATFVTGLVSRWLPPTIKYVTKSVASLVLLVGTGIGSVCSTIAGGLAFVANFIMRKFRPEQNKKQNEANVITKIVDKPTTGTYNEIAKALNIDLSDKKVETIINKDQCQRPQSDRKSLFNKLVDMEPDLFKEIEQPADQRNQPKPP